MIMQSYYDDVGSIAINGPTVRIDLMVQSPDASAGTGKLIVQHRVVMPIDAFLRATQRMQGIVQDMEKRGLIARPAKLDTAGGVVTGKVGKGGKLLK